MKPIQFYTKQSYGKTFRYFVDKTMEDAVDVLIKKRKANEFPTTLTEKMMSALVTLGCQFEEISKE